ncbi:MAG: outer membrane beta-barrel protein [Kangiellaceae bacterium]|nr:outer membrane beta-barrel protein [Kangiellaceae bacterium]
MKKLIVALVLVSSFNGAVIAENQIAEKPPWLFKGTVAYVSPNDSSNSVLGNDGVTVDSGLGLGLSFTYMLDSNWGIEVLAATPFTHEITGTGNLSGLDIGEAKQLPPTVSVTYYWGNETFYHVGAGINYTRFFEENSSSALTEALGADTTDLKLEASVGLSIQVGFDTPINDDWSLSGTVYYKDIDTTADVYVNGAKAASVDVQIDPMVWTLGVSTRF